MSNSDRAIGLDGTRAGFLVCLEMCERDSPHILEVKHKTILDIEEETAWPMAGISVPTCVRHVLKYFTCMILFDSSHYKYKLLHDLNFISEKMEVYRFL